MAQFRNSLWLGAAAAALTAGAAQAQTAGGDVGLFPEREVIIVTTQKRPEVAFDVPLTLTAYSGETLDLLGVTAFDELSTFVPGFTVQLQSPNNPGFVIRGITSDNGNFQDPPRVSVYLNGVDVSRSRGSAFELFDLERVEIARGPQATLFGTAASIGAVSVITARPQEEFAGGGYIGGGDLGYTLVGGYFTGGNSVVQGRLAGQYRRRNGYVDNIAGEPGSNAFAPQDDLNGVETFAVRPSLRFTPTSDFSLDVIFNYERNTPPGTSFKSGVIAPTGGDADPNSFAELGGAEGNLLLEYQGLGPTGPILGLLPNGTVSDFLGDDELGLDREVYDINLTAEWALNDAFTLTGVAGYREFDSLEVFDADGSQVPLVEVSEDTEGEQFSLEARVNYDNGGRFRGFAGVSYFHEEGFQRAPFALDETIFGACAATSPTGEIAISPACVNADGSFNRLNIDPATAGLQPIIPAAGTPGVYYPAEFTNYGDHDTLSVFADLTVDLTDRLEFTAGVRWVDESRESGLSTVFPDSVLVLSQSLLANPTQPVFQPLLPGFANTQGEVVTASGDFDAVLPRFNLLWRATDDLNFYGSIAQGRRSPVISITQTGTDDASSDPSSPDFCDPTALTDDPRCEQLFLPNDTVLPVAELTPEEIVWNYEIGGRAVLAGGRLLVEGAVFYQTYEDFRVQVVDVAAGGVNNVSAGEATNAGFEFEGRLDATDALSFLATYAYIDASIDDDAVNGEFAGNRFRLQPEHSGSIAADYRHALFNAVEGFATVTYTYRSDVFFEPENEPVAGLDLTEDDISLVNLRFGVADFDGEWELVGFVNNVFDEDYIIDAGNTGGDFGSPTFIAGPPRLWGVELRSEF